MFFDNIPDSAVGIRILLLVNGGVRNMTNLAEDWDAFTQHEKDMMITALGWYNKARGKPEVAVALVPFLDKRLMQQVVLKYLDAFVVDGDKDTYKWNRLHNYLKFGPYVRREREMRKRTVKRR